jgi:hypothetical protein
MRRNNVRTELEDRWMTAVRQGGWAKVQSAASYADVSPRTLRKWFESGLRYVKAPSGALLIKLEWLDEFLEKFEVERTTNKIDQIVNEALEGMFEN